MFYGRHFHSKHVLTSSADRRLAPARARQLFSQGPVSVHTDCTEGVTGSEGREGANRAGAGIGVRGGNRDVNGDGDGDGAGTRTGVA